MIEWKIAKRYDNLVKNVQVHETEIPNWEARLATALIERWGVVVADNDGEDAAGRSKLRLLSPQETVGRACDIAAAAVEQFRTRGWVVNLPTLAEIAAHGKPDV